MIILHFWPFLSLSPWIRIQIPNPDPWTPESGSETLIFREIYMENTLERGYCSSPHHPNRTGWPPPPSSLLNSQWPVNLKECLNKIVGPYKKNFTLPGEKFSKKQWCGSRSDWIRNFCLDPELLLRIRIQQKMKEQINKPYYYLRTVCTVGLKYKIENGR